MVRVLFASAVALVVLAWSVSVSPAGEKWYVYRDADSKDNHGHWTNWMPKESAEMLKVSMVDKKDPHTGETCVRVGVTLKPPFWCGIAVSCAPKFWGKKPGVPAFNLSRAKKLVFYARGDQGGEYIQVKVAITGDERFGDSAKFPAATKWLSLRKGWQRYELDLRGYDLKRVVTPFVFVTDLTHNRPGSFTFYLDDIHFED